MSFKTRKLTALAMLAAVSVVLSRFCTFYFAESYRINFGNIPVLLSGLLFGPVAGGLVGAVADIVGSVFLNPLGWNPWLSLSPMLMGICAGLFSRFVLRAPSYPRVWLAALTGNAVSTMTLTTVILHFAYGQPLGVLFAIRLPQYALMSALEALVIFLLFQSNLPKKAGLIHDN